jgi:hypothetical protein
MATSADDLGIAGFYSIFCKDGHREEIYREAAKKRSCAKKFKLIFLRATSLLRCFAVIFSKEVRESGDGAAAV